MAGKEQIKYAVGKGKSTGDKGVLWSLLRQCHLGMSYMGPVVAHASGFAHSPMCALCLVPGVLAGTGPLLDHQVRSWAVSSTLSKRDIAPHGVYETGKKADI